MSGTPKIINPGKAPILWSTIEEAFQNINQNFNDLYATIQSDGSTQVVNFAQLYSDVSPGVTEAYDLGNSSNRWKELWLGSTGLNIGSAVITSTGTSINLPAGSTIGGNVLDQEYFKSIQVSGQPTILAEAGGESSLTISSGTGIGITTNASTDTLTISNSGVTSIAVNSGISINSATGAVTLTNTGVTAISNGTGISVNNSTGSVTITNSGVTRVEAGTGILLDTNTGTVTITNGSPASTIRCFQYISVPNQLQVQADTNADTLNLIPGNNILISTDQDSDTITVAFDNNVDITGSVFADDSTLLVDGVDGKIVGPVDTLSLKTSSRKIALGFEAGSFNQFTDAVAIGARAGNSLQGINAVAIGVEAGETTQGDNAVAIGSQAGQYRQGEGAISLGVDSGLTDQGDYAISMGLFAGGTNQGAYSIAIGAAAGRTNQAPQSIVLNASGTVLNADDPGFFVNPIRSTFNDGSSAISARPVVYDASTKELFYTSSLQFINSTISTTDSSGLTVDVQTTFNTDVTFENDISVSQNITVRGSKVINLTDLKSIVAASTDFNNFKARIAAL